MAEPTVPNSSVSGLVATLLPALLIALVYVLIFLCLRRSQRRYYAPRTYLGSLREQERTPALPSGTFNWFSAFWAIPDTYALQHQSIDAYLFLRFLKLCAAIALVGCFITWPVLLPVNATGGGGGEQLDMLSFSNIDTTQDAGKNRLFAHVFIGWIFYGFVLALVCRESIFYINLRQAFLMSPLYANRLSSRTVLFTSVPEPYLHEAVLRKVFGDVVKKVWITADTADLDKLVEQRDKAAFKLEAAEVKLIKLANKERYLAQKKGGNTDQDVSASTGDAESGSVAARWVPAKKRPTHKLGLLGLFGKKVDTINWSREELERVIPGVEAAQAQYRAGANKKIPAVFIEFTTQAAAQAAFQILSHHQALHMSPRYIGVNPNEIIWSSLRISWWQKVIRRYAVVGFITAMIVFWAIPVAFVGLVSNLDYLSAKYTWLSWISSIPVALRGVITKLFPVVALAILMALVPIVMRLCAKLSGEPSRARVELFTQNAYFVFQVVQVFLVVTLSSGASAALAGIINDPSSTPNLLATALPKAANFYISYFILQGLTLAAGVVSQVVGFVIFKLMYTYLTSTPRSMYKQWTSLSAISWGSVLPVFENIAVISITYAVIAPLTLGFATIGLSLFYLAYRYNVLFVTDSTIDTKGLIYPRALQHLLTGVYLAEVCMIGLAGIAKAPWPLILNVLFLIFTILFHMSMNSALGPLLYALPQSLAYEDELALSGLEETESGTANEKVDNNGLVIPPAPHKKPNMFSKFLKPHIYTDYATLRRLVPHNLVDANSLYTPEIEERAYHPPSAASLTPLLWIPRDEAGVSAQEIAHTSKVIHITDEGATLDEKCKIQWDAEGTRPPIWEDKTYY